MNSTRCQPPFCNIDCQSLIGLEVNHLGWLRHQTIMNSWSKKFVVLIKGHVYIFKNKNSANHMKEFSFSLYGFESVELPILKENEHLWILKLVHTDEARSKIFRASSEPDLNMWTERFNDGIVFANTAQIRQSYAQWPNHSDSGFYNYAGRHYQDGRRGYEQLSTYNEEEPIHQSYSEMSLPQNNSDLYEEVNRTTEVTRPTEVTRQTNCPPELPPRPRSYLDLDKAADDAKKSTNATNIKKNQANQPDFHVYRRGLNKENISSN